MRDAVANSVFNDRLQDQVWQSRVKCLRLDFHLNCEPVLETYALDIQITFQKLEFLLKRNFLGSGILERLPQEVSKPRDHSVGCVGVLVNQRRD